MANMALFIVLFTFVTALISVALFSPKACAAPVDAIRLENDFVAAEFDPATGSMISLINQSTGTQYLAPGQTEIATLFVDHRTASMWEAVPRRAIRLSAPVSHDLIQDEKGRTLSFYYHDDTYKINATVKVTIDNTPFLKWRLEITNQGNSTVVRV